MPSGRFAPTPSGDLHLGNLRTALAAWLFARSTGSSFVVRIEDLDPGTRRPPVGAPPGAPPDRGVEARQLADLTALGLDWDGAPVHQSERFGLYHDAIAQLAADGRTYPCFCTRREIADAAQAPHGSPRDGTSRNGVAPDGGYPGTCARLDSAAVHRRRREGRPAALRLRAEAVEVTFVDTIAGRVDAVVDDLVVQRNDGVPSYNVAVVVDDAAQGIGQVVRGDDLLSSTPRHVLMQRLLGLPEPVWTHVPLVLGSDGRRLAKRHGATTLARLSDLGVSAPSVRFRLAESLGVRARPTDGPNELLARFDPAAVPPTPWLVDPATWTSG
jgi:glutamyl-tRNA synthetase